MHRREPNPKFKNIFFRNVFLEVCPKIPVYATGCLGLHFYIDAAPKLPMAVHDVCTLATPGGRQSTLALEASGPNDTRLY